MPACSTPSGKSPRPWTRRSEGAHGRNARASTASPWRPLREGPVWRMPPWRNATSATSPGPGARIPSSIERSRLSIAWKKASGAEARPRHQPLHGPLSRLAAVVELVQNAEAVLLPFVVVAELRAGFSVGRRGAENERTLRRFLTKPGVAILFADDQTTHQ